MRILRMIGMIGVMLVSAATLFAQRGPQFGTMGAGITAAVFHGVFNPTVGSGAAYDLDRAGTKNKFNIAVVGKEDVSGKPGYWVELAMDNPQGSGRVYAKMLMATDGKNASVTRMIVQPPGMGPMEM